MRTLCFSQRPNRRGYFIRLKTALHRTKNRTASDVLENWWFILSKHNFFQGRESRVHFTSGVNEPQHYQEMNHITFFVFVTIFLHLRDEQHHMADRTASEWKPHYIGRASELHNFFCRTLFFSYEFLLSFFNFLLWTRVHRKDKGKWAEIYIKVYHITILLFR